MILSSVSISGNLSVVALVEQVVVVRAAAVSRGAELTVVDEELEHVFPVKVSDRRDSHYGLVVTAGLGVTVVTITDIRVDVGEVTTRGEPLRTVVVTVTDNGVNERLLLITISSCRDGDDDLALAALNSGLVSGEDYAADVEEVVVTDERVEDLVLVGFGDSVIDDDGTSESLQFVELESHEANVIEVECFVSDVRCALGELVGETSAVRVGLRKVPVRVITGTSLALRLTDVTVSP